MRQKIVSMTNTIREAVARALTESRVDLVKDGYSPLADAAIAAHLKALEEAGFVVVPREPIEAMIRAAVDADIPGGRIDEDTFRESGIGEDDVPVIWRDMIAVAPKAT